MFLQVGDEIRESCANPLSAWRVVRLISSGRHYRVYEVHSLADELGEQRAVMKLLRYDPRRCDQLAYVEHLRARLRHECEPLAHFSPRLPEPLDLFECVNRQDPFEGFGEAQLRVTEPVLVQSMIHGLSLAALMEQRGAPPAPAERLLLCLARVASFLEELHAQGNGWLFGALTPEHVIVDPEQDLEPAFVGCGNFRPLRRGLVAQVEPLDLDEPGYAAPEALCGGPCDARVDIYAMGALLFHIFTGLDPRDVAADPGGYDDDDEDIAPSPRPAAPLAADEANALAERLHRTMERLCRRNLKGLGIHRSRVRKILLRCVSPAPDDRFESPAELREALLACVRRSMPVAWSSGEG